MTDPYTHATLPIRLIPNAMRTIHMLSTPCPKCALGTLAGPTYQRIPECLVYRCTVCGYREERATVDATTRPTGIPTPNELEKWRERWSTTPNLRADDAKGNGRRCETAGVAADQK